MGTVIDTVDAIEDALGGRPAALQKLGVSPSTLSGWKTRGIPPARYKQINELLVPIGVRPADELFFGRAGAAEETFSG